MVAAIEQFVGDLETAEPKEIGSLRFVPLVGRSRRKPAYRLLSKENQESVTISEVGEDGSVPVLIVVNEGENRVFIMDGEQLIGAKQNRILNTDVLVPAKSETRIPVSCVEAGRWQYLSRNFSSSGSASYHVRHSKMDRVHRSLKEKRGHDADQGAVWNDVASSMSTSGHRSPTSAMNDAYRAERKKLQELRRGLKLPKGTIGVAVFRDDQLLGIDLFNRTSAMRHYFKSLVDSYLIERLAESGPNHEKESGQPDVTAVTDRLSQLATAEWEGHGSPGDGDELRLEHPDFVGSALVCEDAVVHLQLFPRDLPEMQTSDGP